MRRAQLTVVLPSVGAVVLACLVDSAAVTVLRLESVRCDSSYESRFSVLPVCRFMFRGPLVHVPPFCRFMFRGPLVHVPSFCRFMFRGPLVHVPSF